jgi:hypothetical protein
MSAVHVTMEVVVAEDGTFLRIKPSTGREALVSLEDMAESMDRSPNAPMLGVIRLAIRDFIAEVRTGRLGQEAVTLEAEPDVAMRELAEALVAYGIQTADHASSCAKHRTGAANPLPKGEEAYGPRPCTCGLEKIRATTKAVLS